MLSCEIYAESFSRTSLLADTQDFSRKSYLQRRKHCPGIRKENVERGGFTRCLVILMSLNTVNIILLWKPIITDKSGDQVLYRIRKNIFKNQFINKAYFVYKSTFKKREALILAYFFLNYKFLDYL